MEVSAVQQSISTSFFTKIFPTEPFHHAQTTGRTEGAQFSAIRLFYKQGAPPELILVHEKLNDS
jgi:hypothetical protein